MDYTIDFFRNIYKDNLISCVDDDLQHILYDSICKLPHIQTCHYPNQLFNSLEITLYYYFYSCN